MLRTVLSVTAACAAVVAPVITDALSQGAQANIYVRPAVTVPMPDYAQTVDYPAAAPTRGYPWRSGGGSGRGSYRGGSYPTCGYGSTCGAVPLNSNPTGLFGTGTW